MVTRTPSPPDIDDLYPLSPLQQGMLLETLRRPGSGAYVQQFLCRIRGALDPQAFERAWHEVVQRHAILRASMLWGDTPEPLHMIHRHPPHAFTVMDWRGVSADAHRVEMDRTIADDRARGFDPADPPLMRFLLVRLAAHEWRFLWTHHHLLLDGWSLGLLLQDVRLAYDALAAKEPVRLPARPPFREYIAWLRRLDRQAAEQFWRARLHGVTEATRLRYVPRTAPSPPPHTPRTPSRSRAELIVDETLRATLTELARSEHVTLNVVLQGCWALVLSQYAGTDDVLFGMTTSGRTTELPGAERMIGPFINTVPVRARVTPDCSVVDWLRAHQVDLVAQRAFEHTALVDIRRWSDLPPDAAMFDTLFVFQNYPSARTSTFGDVEILDATSYEQTDVPLIVVVQPSDRLVIGLETTDARWTHTDLQRIGAHFDIVLRQVAAEPTRPLGAIDMLSPQERRRVLRRGAPLRNGASHRGDVMAQFHRTAAAAPDAPAIVVGTESWSFACVEERASRVAGHLRAHGIGIDQVVAVNLGRSPSLLIAILGILDAGAAFLVVDPMLPPARRAFLLQDAAPSAVIGADEMDAMLGGTPLTAPSLADGGDRPHVHADADVPPASLAYVVYTSGSTGRPKGVMVTREGLTNYVRWAIDAYAVRDHGGAPWHGSLAFDLSFTSVFCPLLAGRPVIVVPEEDGPDGLARLLRARGAFSFLKATPAHARALGDQLLDREIADRTRHLVVGGEALRARDVERFRSHGDAIVVNEYGPTETVVGCSAAFVRPDDRVDDEIPIGDPIAGMELVVLDRHLRPVPVGVPGELHVGGVGVARGYKGRPDLTAERFVPHPFATVPGERLYRTGDLVRRHEDDALVYLGRIDAQVKVSGYRIEPGEVEQALLSHPAVQQAVVIASQDRTQRSQLAAYVVLALPTPSPSPSAVESLLRAHLAERLPDYMVPAAIVVLDEMPIAAGGKIDRSRLPRVDRGSRASSDARRASKRHVAPRDRAELELQRVWQHVLGAVDVGVHDRFFDLGGDSLKAMHLAGQIRRHLGVEISVAAVLEHATIETMAAHLRSHANGQPSSSLVVLRDGVQDGAHDSPLVCVHPASGSITPYLELIAFVSVDRPVLGFQSQALDGRVLPQGSIEEMARRYVGELIASRWTGPAEIIGWSSGALVAFEMAVQLAECGHRSSRVTLIDTPCPKADRVDLPVADNDGDGDGHGRVLVASFARGLGIAPQALAHAASTGDLADVDAALDRICNEAHQLGTLPEGVDRRSVRARFDVYAANVAAARRYRPRHYDGPVLVVIAESGLSARSGEHGADLGWGCCAPHVETTRVAGDHYSVMQAPHVQALAVALQREPPPGRAAAMECSP